MPFQSIRLKRSQTISKKEAGNCPSVEKVDLDFLNKGHAEPWAARVIPTLPT